MTHMYIAGIGGSSCSGWGSESAKSSLSAFPGQAVHEHIPRL